MTAPHTILGVSKDATQEEIRTAWRALVRRAHPDQTPRDRGADDRMKAINAAHDAMLDALERAKSTRRTEAEKGRARPTHETASDHGFREAPRAWTTGATASPVPPAPDRPFETVRSLKPGPVLEMRMRAALLGHLRRLLNQESARLGGAAYAVKGQPGWRPDDEVLHSGGLPGTHQVTRVDYSGGVVRLHLDSLPEPGHILIALPRLEQVGPARIRQDQAVSVIEIVVPGDGRMPLSLPEDVARKAVSGLDGVTVEIVAA